MLIVHLLYCNIEGSKQFLVIDGLRNFLLGTSTVFPRVTNEFIQSTPSSELDFSGVRTNLNTRNY